MDDWTDILFVIPVALMLAFAGVGISMQVDHWQRLTATEAETTAAWSSMPSENAEPKASTEHSVQSADASRENCIRGVCGW